MSSRAFASTPPRGFWAAAREAPDRVALIDAEEREWTAGELLSGANRLVHALRARGVQPFDPLATLTRNSAELFQTLLAVFQAGWQYVPLNTHLTAAEVGYIVGDSGADRLRLPPSNALEGADRRSLA